MSDKEIYPFLDAPDFNTIVTIGRLIQFRQKVAHAIRRGLLLPWSDFQRQYAAKNPRICDYVDEIVTYIDDHSTWLGLEPGTIICEIELTNEQTSFHTTYDEYLGITARVNKWTDKEGEVCYDVMLRDNDNTEQPIYLSTLFENDWPFHFDYSL